ncbi:unnamed protein product [Gadus morhua 'NCC']
MHATLLKGSGSFLVSSGEEGINSDAPSVCKAGDTFKIQSVIMRAAAVNKSSQDSTSPPPHGGRNPSRPGVKALVWTRQPVDDPVSPSKLAVVRAFVEGSRWLVKGHDRLMDL